MSNDNNNKDKDLNNNDDIINSNFSFPQQRRRRWCDDQTCAVVSCQQRIEPGSAAMVLATNNKLYSRLATKRIPARMIWTKNGCQAIHFQCYEQIVQNIQNTTSSCWMSTSEQRLFASAQESCERFDSLQSVQDAALQAAQLVATHCTKQQQSQQQQQEKDDQPQYGEMKRQRRQRRPTTTNRPRPSGLVAFTGAGISQAAGIPTYRGTEGIDTKQELGHDNNQDTDNNDNNNTSDNQDDWSYETLQPTATHLALAQLEVDGWLSYTVSQNCDNLHRRALQSVTGKAVAAVAEAAASSSTAKANDRKVSDKDHNDGHASTTTTTATTLSELHGNVFIEYCQDCHMEYVRDFPVDAYSTDCSNEPWYVECRHCHWGHFTGRKCTAVIVNNNNNNKKRRHQHNSSLTSSGSRNSSSTTTTTKTPTTCCGGQLRDTIINFGDPLNEIILNRAMQAYEKASVCLAMGSSLSVSPANSLPMIPPHLIIVNPQMTDLDDQATIRVFATSDEFMALFMSALQRVMEEAETKKNKKEEDGIASNAAVVLQKRREDAIARVQEDIDYSKQIDTQDQKRKRPASSSCVTQQSNDGRRKS